jgi:hypothetical protein
LALTSGDNATPASPKAPERESGDTVKKGTAVGMAVALLPLVLVVPAPIAGFWAFRLLKPPITIKLPIKSIKYFFAKFIAVSYNLFSN